MKANKQDALVSGGFALLILIIIVMSIIGAMIMNRMHNIMEQTSKDTFTVVIQTKEANANLIAVHRGMKDVALARNFLHVESALQEVDKYDAEIKKNLIAIKQLDITNILVDDIIREYQEWESIRVKTIDFVQNGQYEAAAEVTRTQSAQQVDLISEKMKLLIEDKEAERKAAVNSLKSMSE